MTTFPQHPRTIVRAADDGCAVSAGELLGAGETLRIDAVASFGATRTAVASVVVDSAALSSLYLVPSYAATASDVGKGAVARVVAVLELIGSLDYSY